MDAPDYSSHTAAQLRQILGRIDAARFPERVAEIEARLAQLASQPAPPAAGSSLSPVIAPLWRRLLAFLIDTFLLGLLGIALGALLHAQFAALGSWGRLVGFIIALLYFGLTQSHLRGGQSAGMHLLGLRVVTRAGEPLSLPAALLRAAIYCMPYFLNGAVFADETDQRWPDLALLVLIGSASFISVYLIVFNRKTRQSLYDLAVGAYVVHAGPGKITLLVERIWRGHAAVVAILVVVIAVASVVMPQQLPAGDSVLALNAARKAISKMPDVGRTSVLRQVHKTDGKTLDTVLISAVVHVPPAQPQVLAQRMALAVLDTHPEAGNPGLVMVSLLSGYDIGIASSMSISNFAHTPADWRSGAIKAVQLQTPW